LFNFAPDQNGLGFFFGDFKMTQKELNDIHEFVMVQITHYASGIITLKELRDTLNKLDLNNISGLIDPASGLRFYD
jgi:hypothetical protein